MDILNSQIDYVIKNKIIVCEKDKIVLGLSGGPDSVFLLLLLDRLKIQHGLEFIVCHVNYNLRGQNSLQDRIFCERLCKEHNIILNILECEIEEKTSVQEKARNIRFDYFREILIKNKFNYIALGHNLDDNIETVLHNIIRGCGLNGLKGLDEVSKDIVRPILGISKKDITQYLEENSIEFRKDLSNDKNCYTRNKIRNNIVKEILSINPSFYNVFRYFAENIKDIDCFVRLNTLDNIENNLIHCQEGKIVIVNNKLFAEKRFDNIYINLLLREYLNIEEGVYSSNIREIIKIVRSGGGKHTVVKDFIVLNDYNNVIFIKKTFFDDFYPDFEETEIYPDRNIDSVKFADINRTRLSTNEMNIDMQEIKWPIVLRHRKNGDRIGTDTLLKKRFIDRKINRLLRDRVPVFEDSEGKIIWVPGVFKKKFENVNTKLIYTRRMFWIKTEN